MVVRQEFVVIPVEGGVRVYGVPRFFLRGPPIGPDAQKLHVEGPLWVASPTPS